jgi:hypothetical protein
MCFLKKGLAPQSAVLHQKASKIRHLWNLFFQKPPKA